MDVINTLMCFGFIAGFLLLIFGPWGTEEDWSDAMESLIEHKRRNATLTVAPDWCAPDPEPDREPQFWDTWKGYNHGSLYKVLAVDDERVCYLVMWQGNPYWQEERPPGTVQVVARSNWKRDLFYAPEWND